MKSGCLERREKKEARTFRGPGRAVHPVCVEKVLCNCRWIPAKDQLLPWAQRLASDKWRSGRLQSDFAVNCTTLGPSWCGQIHLPHATIFTCTVTAQITQHECTCTLAQVRVASPKKVIHPRVMFHLAPHCTLNISTSSLSPTSPLLLSSSSPNPDLLSRLCSTKANFYLGQVLLRPSST